ncbi:hypothetical protein ACQKPE_12850 [Pseudomonas sp. NPDC089554]|uniref:hypothetical protein n=1 Tax=Pseudomonas sp. NPDC089554 TaxID=3390653 RepID=UPI003D06650C
MLKIVPDPPCPAESTDYLEDILVDAMEHALCGLAVSNQSIACLPKSPATIMLRTVSHELDAVHSLLECALERVQLKRQSTLSPIH